MLRGELSTGTFNGFGLATGIAFTNLKHVILDYLHYEATALDQKGRKMLWRQTSKDSVPTPYATIWFGLKWNMIFVATALLGFILFKADRAFFGSILVLLFIFFFVRDYLRFSRRARKGIVRTPKRLS